MEIWLGINSKTGYCCRILIRSKFEVEYKAEAYGCENDENLVQNIMKQYHYQKVGQPEKLPYKLQYEYIGYDMGAKLDFSFDFDTVQRVKHIGQ